MTRIETLCLAMVELIPASGAAVVVRGGPLHSQLVYAGDSVVVALTELEFTLGEGPGRDCYRLNAALQIPDLTDGAAFEQWPGFAHEATTLGAAAVFAYPLHDGATPFGTVELYRATPGLATASAALELRSIVGQLEHAVIAELTRNGSPTTGQLPVFGRPEVAQASGMIAVQLDVSIPDALAQLRASAFAEQTPIHQLAVEVIERRRRFTEDRH